MVSWKAPAPPLSSPGPDCAVGGRSWLRGWETPWAGLCSPEARRAWGGEPPLHAFVPKHIRAAASGSGGRAAGVTHDVTDNDTSRVFHPHTAPELHNVTPGTPGTPRSWRKLLAPRTLALRLLRPLSASPGALARPGGGGRGPAGEPRGRAGERVMSRALVGGSPGGEAPPGEFSESSAALH